MHSFQPDNRKLNLLLIIGLSFFGLACLAMLSKSAALRIVATSFLIFWGLVYTGIALFMRYIVRIENGMLIIKSRLGVFTKRIPLEDIRRVRVNSSAARKLTILNLVLRQKKFMHYRHIELFDLIEKKLFTIDGQSMEDTAYLKLIQALKNQAANNQKE